MPITVTEATTEDAETIARFNQLMALETEHKTLPWESIYPGVCRLISQSPDAAAPDAAAPDAPPQGDSEGTDAQGFYLIARISETGPIVGCLGITFEWSDWRNGLFWWIQSVYVDAGYRQRGVFSALYGAVRNRALQSKHVIGLRLYVERDNYGAQSTYTRLGMIETDYRLMEEEF